MACAPPLETAQKSCDAIVFYAASTPMAVRDALQAVLMHPLLARLSEDARGSTEMVLAEVLNNIVEHAYARPDGQIELRLQCAQSRLLCEVVDAGRPMPDLQLPKGLAQSIGPECDLPEGGFGWFLIRSLTENLAYRRIDARNHLSFQLNIEQ